MIPKTFESRLREFPPFLLAELNIHKKEYGLFLNQTAYGEAINELTTEALFDDFRTTRHKLAWISHTRPEILAGVNIICQAIQENVKVDNVKITN